MRNKLIAALCAFVGLLSSPLAALAAEEEQYRGDAKVMGYGKQVAVPDASMTLMWATFVLLAVICIAVLFKDAKRTHLD